MHWTELFLDQFGHAHQCRINASSTMIDMTNAGVNLYKPLWLIRNVISGITKITPSGHISGGYITTTSWHISSNSGKVVSLQALACTGTTGQFASMSSAGVYMGLDSTTAGGLDILFFKHTIYGFHKHILPITSEGWCIIVRSIVLFGLFEDQAPQQWHWMRTFLNCHHKTNVIW